MGKNYETPEIEVIPADDPNIKPLNFVIKEYDGTAISRDPAGKEIITTKDSLKIGDIVYIQTLVGIYRSIICQDESGKLYATNVSERSGMGTIMLLEFRDDILKDDRAPIWISWGAVNRRGIQKQNMKTVIK